MKPKKDVQFEQPSELLLIFNKYMLAFIGVIVITILALGYTFLLRPKLGDIKTVQDESTETQERKLQNEKLLTKIKELKSEYEDIKNNRSEDLKKLQEIVPEDPQMAELFVIADRLALENGFQLTSINITEVKEENRGPEPGAEEPQFERTEGLIDPEIEKAQIIANVDSLNLDSYRPKDEDVASKIGLKFLTVHLSYLRIKDVAAVDEELLSKWGFTEEEKVQFLQDFENNMSLRPYKAFKQFLASLEAYMRLSDINSVSFSAFQQEMELPEEGEEDTSVQLYGEGFNIDITTYYK